MTTKTLEDQTQSTLATNGKANGEGSEPKKNQIVTIKAPNMEIAKFTIRGTSQLVMNRFGAKSLQEMHDQQVAGSTAKKNKKRTAKDFKAQYEEAKHVSREGWCGIPSNAFRSAMISACRTVGFTMTRAKLSVFIPADGVDAADGSPLTKITKGEPEYFEAPVNLSNGVKDLRARPLWMPGWESIVTVRWDADQFTASDVVNLLARVGAQVGICEGRPDSKSSCGMGWGLFEVVTEDTH